MRSFSPLYTVIEYAQRGDHAPRVDADGHSPVSAGYEILRYRPGHKPLVAELQKELWSSDASLNARYLEWKYENDRNGLEPLIYLALHDGKPIGMRGFHEARLEAGTPSRAFPVLIAGDALISAAHRNRGLVARIMELAYADLAGRGCSYLMSIGGANRINALGMLSLGWRSAGAMKPMGRVTAQVGRTLKMRRAVSRMPILWRFSESRWLASADQRHPFRHLDAAKPERDPADRPPISTESRPRSEAMVDLIRRAGHDGRIRYVRDRTYLDWCFSNPLSEYRFLYWMEERLEGYLVLSRRKSDLGGWDRVYIVDLEATSPRIRSALLTAAMEWGRFPELVAWTASLSGEDVQLLVSRGFVPVDPEDTSRGCPCILVRALGHDLPAAEWELGGRALLDILNWDIRVLYSMRG